MLKNKRFAAAVAASAMASFAADVASAACTRLAFSVNDYGKVGPTEDAKRLLDPYIKKWTSDRGIKTYTVGPKDVTCELFIDLIVFDEYTCKAAATVCWNGPLPKNHEVEAGAPAPSVNKAASRPAAPAQPKAAGGPAPAGQAPASTLPISTGSVRPAPAAAPAAPKAAPAAAPAAAAPAAAPAPAPAAPSAAPAN